MRAFRDIRIRQKLMLMAMLASSLALVTVSVGFLAYEISSSRRATLERLGTVTEIIAHNATDAVVLGDDVAADVALSTLHAERGILSACIYDRDGALFADYTRPDADHSCAERKPPGVPLEAAFREVTFAVPLLVQTEPFGELVIRARTLEVSEQVLRYAEVVSLGLLASGLLAFLLASNLQRFISEPILHLVRTSRRISAERDYSLRAERRGEDELGLLIDSFNEMLAQIQERDRLLEQHREELEAQVAKRTADLSAAVDELTEEVDQRKLAEEKISYLAYYDVLTGLPNRELLKERLNEALRDSAQDGDSLALLFLDLDRFKEINDSLGHSAGDELLWRVAKRLVKSVRASDSVTRAREHGVPLVSRQGGDEFTVILSDIRSGYDASRVAMRILESLSQPFTVSGREVVVGASIGIAVYPSDGEDADTLLKHADAAMYHAKEQGRNDYQYFTESMKEAALNKITVENELRKAISAKEFELHYQPKVDLHEQQILGVEALMRWNHPERGLVLPSEFIPIAEEIGLIVPMGEWAVRTACEQLASWHAEGFPVTVAVNVSSHQFRKSTLVKTIESVIEDSGIAPEFLELEITESAMLKDEEEAVDTLGRLKGLGVRIALDDFGTGYSSLSYVSRLPLDSLKIDRSFIRNLTHSREDAGIVTAIIAMAHSLGLTVVAEGVETEAQLALLRARDCDQLQGFLYSRPLPADELGQLLRHVGHRSSGTA